jgi:hypothetical protein
VLRSPRWNPGIQNGKPVRVLYSLPIQIQTAINVGKGIKYSEEIAQRAIFLVMAILFFRCLSSFGIIDYLYETFLRYEYIGLPLEFFSSYSFIRGIRIINDNKD